MKLYNYWRSSSSYRVRLALHHKQLPFEYVAVSLIKGEQHQAPHRARSAAGTVPVLEDVVDGKPVVLTQSVAIFEYLEERFPARPLLPKDAVRRGQVRALAELINSGIQPLQNLSVLNYVKDTLRSDSAAWAKHWISQGMTALEAQAKETAGRFLVGDEFTWADCCLVPQLFAARRFGADPAACPTLLAIEARCLELDAVQKSKPDVQPDAQP